MDPDGSNVRQLTVTSWRNAQPKVSPDGRTLLFTSMWNEFREVALYEMDLRTEAVTNLSARANTAGAIDSDPKWSSNGDRIVFANSVGHGGTVPTQTYLMNASGDGRRAVTHDRYFNTDPELSPDGRYVAIASYRGHGHPGVNDPNNPFAVKLAHWILVVRSISSDAERELNLGKPCYRRPVARSCGPLDGPAYVPNWTPDGAAIGFISILSSRSVCICLVDADGSDPAIAFESSDLAVTWFDWARPGPAPASVGAIGTAVPNHRLLYGGRDGAGVPFLAVSMPDRWGDVRLRIPGGLTPTSARWTLDRRGIIFTANVPYNRHRWQPYPERSQRPRHIHFTLDFLSRLFVPPFERPDVAEQQSFLYELDTGAVRQLTTPWIEDYVDALPRGDFRGNIDPDVSPDGRHVVVTNVSSLTNESFILRLDLKTGQVYNLTNATAGAMPVADSGARYSPDGTRIAFTCAAGTESQICVVDSKTGKDFVQLTHDDFFNIAPAWDPSGRFIVYSSYHGGNLFGMPDDPAALAATGDLPLEGWCLVKVNARTGARTILVNGSPPAFRPVWSPDGRRIMFISISSPGQPDLYVMDVNGGDPRPVQVTHESHEVFVDWR
jgi:Tol biopolymer transport system component